MALIQCPECGTEVSDKAKQCGKCSHPITSQSTASDVQTIEQTSKKLKRHFLIGSIILFVGVMSVIFTSFSESDGVGIAMALASIGFIWVIVAKVRSWWHHG